MARTKVMRIVPSPQRPRTWLVVRERHATHEEYEHLLAFIRAWRIAMRVGASSEPDLALELGPMSVEQEFAFANEFAHAMTRAGEAQRRV